MCDVCKYIQILKSKNEEFNNTQQHAALLDRGVQRRSYSNFRVVNCHPDHGVAQDKNIIPYLRTKLTLHTVKVKVGEMQIRNQNCAQAPQRKPTTMQKNTCQIATTIKTIVLRKEKRFAILTNEPVPLPQLTMHIVKVEEMQITTRIVPEHPR